MKNTSITEILDKIGQMFPNAKTELDYKTNFQFLVAVILSAQSTDIQVNKVTSVLFKKVSQPADILNMGEDNLKDAIKSIGFFNNKSKNIFKLSQKLLETNSKIPDTLDELIKLPGVGLKTAKLVLAQIYGQEYIPVDTHIFRISNRLGIVDTKTPEETSEILEKIIPDEYKSKAHHLMIFFGRYHCTAKKPKCDICPFTSFCKFYKLNIKNDSK